ncbi:DNA polymerase Y family protein [Agrobacterium vitis]|uniref:DNA polymerase Y family protein n=1 Tax=Agrobacterium vitis TaxID=373 RepID=A0AAE5AXW6_AGRVI|nr:DNA polymerase Y family protein [Agrobacterium vitis]MCF1501152.1 DNA polymerase Y family protein [Allorhizobium sp. Av2]MCM2440511.1 DNA polymerase Y family protein [Agrobacterium vitis]MUZ59497.1 DNA polymerase Y family protein [Agrobacterium vitis]MVA66741.1 DNA polymerase Y family protein [Agrobacterium vitis]MVA87604.1 DNA polymerase Y family protein [Agrobacterium vitis]
MPRVVSLFLPTWPTDRLRRTSDATTVPLEAPLVLIGRQGQRRVVTAADSVALAAGLRVGMPAAKAQALVPGLIVRDADPLADVRALNRLALWALRYTPAVAADPPDGLVIDTTGADHLHGGEAAMLTDMIARIEASGTRVRAAIADTWGAAHALARYQSRPALITPPGESRLAMLDLPIRALRVARETVEGLRVMGFTRIGEVAAQPRAPLTLRFGPELGRRIDQAFGILNEPILRVQSPDLTEVQRIFAEPIAAAETIARYIGKLVVHLCDALEIRGLGVRHLDLLCYRVDNQIALVRVATAQPVRHVRRLTRLLCDKIDTIDPGFGIERMVLVATSAEPLVARQIATSLAEPSDPDVSDLIDILANRIGASRIYRFGSVPSDVPERAVSRLPPLSPDTGEGWTNRWPRPSRLFTHPEPIETVALLPDQPPVVFTWRGVRRRVRRADGPERVFGEWWRRDAEMAAVRDYFQVEVENGERYWIYRAGNGVDPATGSHLWFLHGVFG